MLKMSYEEYLNKVHGGWIGKTIGGTIGERVECHKGIMNFDESTAFPEEVLPNDDLDLQVLWLHVLKEKGIEIESKDLADAWLKHCWYPFNEYGVFLKNYQLGIAPPVSGWFNNSFFWKSMGSPIRSEIWAFICPGNPTLAMEYARLDGCLDHNAEGFMGEEFLAALEASAFVGSNIRMLIENALMRIPERSELSRAVRLVIDGFQQGLPWKETRARLLRHFGSPDSTHSTQNLGITVLALLYGEGDFAATQLIALNSGYDTDCTAATAGALMGVISGANSLPRSWKGRIDDRFVLGIDLKIQSNRLIDLALETCKVGLEVSRSKNRMLQIIGGPTRSRKVPCSKEPLKITVRYEGLPSIGWHEERRLCIELKNRVSYPISATILLDVPEHLEVEYEPKRVIVQPGSSEEIRAVSRLKQGIEILPQKNVLTLSITGDHGTVAKRRVGLSGAKVALIYGPYWDIYDTSHHSECPWYNASTISRPTIGQSMTDYVDIEREYIDEKRLIVDHLPGGEVVNLPEDRVKLTPDYKPYGAAVAYLVEEPVSPVIREAWLAVGSGDAYRLWLNGRLILANDRARSYNPYNDSKIVQLKSGKNRLVAKILRHSNEFEFSYAFLAVEKSREKPHHNRLLTDLGSSLPGK